MKVIQPQANNEDERGKIIDILVREPIEYVTFITSEGGSIRGNHYHKKTVQMVYILHGKMKLLTQIPGGKVLATILNPGDLAVTEPNERHSMVALEFSEFMVFTRGVRGGDDYEKDTYRLEESLCEE